MKKFLALFLVLVMAFSCVLISCKKEDEPIDDDEDDGEFVGINTQATTTLAPGATTTAPSNVPADQLSWTDNTDTVYIAVGQVNVRSDTVINDSTKRATAKFGESYTRVKISDRWSLIDFKGNQYYISNDCITTEAGSILFTDMAETTVYVIAEKSLNLRQWTDASEGAENIGGTVFNGDELVQTGVSQNGKWARISYKGAVLYCSTSYISTTAPTATTTASPIVTAPPQG
ncbi:MAG: hypothetical protein E7641_02820 [Ruminococcaceae bacterium]|nr:hypothetical protein [Oscillospiraceae bacterium]